jgi:hypothetical protein
VEGEIVSSPQKRADRLDQVRTQVDYHRQRLVLYQRLHGSHPSARLAELEKAYLTAQKRMARVGGPSASSSRVSLD